MGNQEEPGVCREPRILEIRQQRTHTYDTMLSSFISGLNGKQGITSRPMSPVMGIGIGR